MTWRAARSPVGALGSRAAVPRPRAQPRPPARQRRHGVPRHRAVIAGGVVGGVLMVGAWLCSGRPSRPGPGGAGGAAAGSSRRRRQPQHRRQQRRHRQKAPNRSLRWPHRRPPSAPLPVPVAEVRAPERLHPWCQVARTESGVARLRRRPPSGVADGRWLRRRPPRRSPRPDPGGVSAAFQRHRRRAAGRRRAGWSTAAPGLAHQWHRPRHPVRAVAPRGRQKPPRHGTPQHGRRATAARTGAGRASKWPR